MKIDKKNFGVAACALVVALGLYSLSTQGSHGIAEKRATSGDVQARPDMGRYFTSLNSLDATIERYITAAGQNNVKAQDVLGWLSSTGEASFVSFIDDLGAAGQHKGKLADCATAVSWWRAAAEHGNYDAQFYLGFLYMEGLGVFKDDVEAYYWLSLAARSFSPMRDHALKLLDSAGRRLTQEQKSAAVIRAWNWKSAPMTP